MEIMQPPRSLCHGGVTSLPMVLFPPHITTTLVEMRMGYQESGLSLSSASISEKILDARSGGRGVPEGQGRGSQITKTSVQVWGQKSYRPREAKAMLLTEGTEVDGN